MSTRETAQSQSVEFENALEVGKQHLDFFTLSARLLEGIGLGYLASNVTGALMNAAGNLALRRIRTAFGLAWACRAIMLTCTIDDGVFLGDVNAGTLEKPGLKLQS